MCLLPETIPDKERSPIPLRLSKKAKQAVRELKLKLITTCTFLRPTKRELG